MLDDKALHELLHYTSPEPILSVYLDTDLTQGNRSQFALSLRSVLRGVTMPADEAVIIQNYEREKRWSGRSAAMFSCVGQGFLRSFAFAVPVKSLASSGRQPYVKPLVDLMDAHGHWAVALVDKEGTRLFLVHLGEIRELEGIRGQEVHRTKRGGASSFPGRRGGIAGRTRHTEEMVDRNMREAVEGAVRQFDQHGARRLLLGGTEENTHRFQAALPAAWQKAVMGTFAVGMKAGTEEILGRVNEIGEQADLRRESILVEELITAAAKGGTAVVELEDTLRAIREGRIRLLLVDEGFSAPGFRCRGCGYLTTMDPGTCPFCAGPFDRIDDAVELATRETLAAGGEIEIVRNHPSMKRLSIGAILRY